MNIENIFKELMELPRETECVEWKTASKDFSFEELGKYFSALSNEANLKSKSSGWIIFGVTNNKVIAGTQYRTSKESLDSLKQEIALHTMNGITFAEIHELFTKDSKRVLLFEIPPAPKGIPTSWKGHFYARNGESLVALSLEKQERIRAQGSNNDWSAGICSGAKMEDLDQEAILKAREGFARKNPKLNPEEIMSWDDVTFLNKAKITIQGHITRAAILLLGKSESEHFISPATAKISWILKDQNGVEKDYEHFTCPLILSVEKVYQKIRNLRYRYISDGSLFPDEIDRYDPITIREALNNCIAHQDYLMGGKINVVENEDDSLIFTNLGTFIPETVENVIESDAPTEYYRNKFLAQAMVNVNMIDTVGSGIKKMFISQKNKFFPLPEYDLSKERVKLTIIGKVLDVQYARKLAQIPNLNLGTILLLDKVQKKKKLTQEETNKLRRQNLIEGRQPNIYISSQVAAVTGEKGTYIKNRGFKDAHYKQTVIDYLKKYKSASRSEINDLLLDILPKVLSDSQKINKVSNILYSMSKKDKSIINNGTNRYPKWTLSLTNT